MKSRPEKPALVYTIGHSTRSFEEFISLLNEFGVGAVVDIRRYPGSRKFPQFNQDALRHSLQKEKMLYLWLEGLGGRRRARKDFDSPNKGLQSRQFRNYADYMMTDEFRAVPIGGNRDGSSLSRRRGSARLCAPRRCTGSVTGDLSATIFARAERSRATRRQLSSTATIRNAAPDSASA